MIIPEQSASSAALQQVDSAPTHGKRSSDRNRRRPSYYGFGSSSDYAITGPPKRPRRAGAVENYQPPPELILETVLHIADQQPDETNISPIIGDVSPPAPQNQLLLDIDIPTLVRSMTVIEAKNEETMDE